MVFFFFKYNWFGILNILDLFKGKVSFDLLIWKYMENIAQFFYYLKNNLKYMHFLISYIIIP